MSPLYMDQSPDLHSSIASSTTVHCVPDQTSVRHCFGCSFKCFTNSSNWSSSTSCWEFCHQFLSAITLKLMQIFFITYDHFRTDPFIRLMRSAANGCYGINHSWYPILSKLRSYKCEHWRLFVDFPYKNY